MIQQSTVRAELTTDCPYPRISSLPGELRLPLATNRGLLLSGLRFPWQTGVEVRTGQLSITVENGLPQHLRANSCCLVPADVRFDLLLLPQAGAVQTGTCQLVLNRGPVWQIYESLSNEAARRVFDAPCEPWTVALLAESLCVSPSELGRRLFAEDASARSIVRTQRLMRAVVLALTTDLSANRIAAESGWPDLPALRRAARDVLLCDITRRNNLAAVVGASPLQNEYRWPTPALQRTSLFP